MNNPIEDRSSGAQPPLLRWQQADGWTETVAGYLGTLPVARISEAGPFVDAERSYRLYIDLPNSLESGRFADVQTAQEHAEEEVAAFLRAIGATIPGGTP